MPGKSPLLVCMFVATALSSAVDRAEAAPLKVAIVPSIAVNLDTARVDALSQDLAAALATELDIETVGGLEVRRLLPPDGVPPECVTTPACISDVAQRTGASQLLFVVMVDSGTGGSIQIDTTWVDTASAQSVSRPAIDLTSTIEARAKFAAAARQLLPDAPVRARPVSTSTVGVIAPGVREGVPRHFTTPAKIAAAVGAVGLGAGIAFGLAARSRFSDCERDPAGCSDSDRSTIRTHAALADVGFVLATGGAIATAILYLTSGREPQLIVSPTVDGAAASWVGRF